MLSFSHQAVMLASTAAFLGFSHTIIGPDHYVPFIAMSKARKWSMHKTFWITTACGFGHILSSVLLGFLGIALGTALSFIDAFEEMRGEVAAWVLLAFGFTYLVWGVHRAIKKKHHHHHHHHGKDKSDITPWILFTVFFFGPCEPLIPILMYPAATESFAMLFLVVALFSITTVATMLCVVMLAVRGISLVNFSRFAHYDHAIAGFTIFSSGAAIKFLGL
jgi:nickel/cobalt transporter (NicO) family protein